MPKATAVWLIENTALTFEQIGEYCGLHSLEIQGIADGEVAVGIVGRDPIANGDLSKDEIETCEKDNSKRLSQSKDEIQLIRRSVGPRYTPLSKRQNRPDAIAWLTKYHPELSDAQICRLVGTTKPTVVSVKDRTHWNIINLKLTDPVTLGMCTQTELDHEISKASRRLQNKEKKEKKIAAKLKLEKDGLLEENKQNNPGNSFPSFFTDSTPYEGSESSNKDNLENKKQVELYKEKDLEKDT
tara:strand:+ start:164 stop:889 length:726 start_codon:yes stop_codon:yes gene_type:complete